MAATRSGELLGEFLAGVDAEPLIDVAEVDTVAGLRAWRDLLVGHQRTLECRGGCPLGTLGAELAGIDDVALATLAARPGGLLLAQVQRDPRPLEVALDPMIDRIQALIETAATGTVRPVPAATIGWHAAEPDEPG